MRFFIPLQGKQKSETMGPDHGGEVWDCGHGVIDYSSNINPLGPSRLALKTLESWKLECYPPPNPVKLKKALARHVGVSQENITLGNGSMELIKDFCTVFLKKTDSTVVLEPAFSEYARYARLYGKSVKRTLPKMGFEHSIKGIIKSLDRDTRLLFLGRPNNPTGWTIPDRDLKEVLDFTRDRDVLVFLDEAFIDFTHLNSFGKEVGGYENLFVLRSFTKFFALPGLRIGYGIGERQVIERLEEIKPPWNINVFAHDAALASLKDRPYMERTKKLVERERAFLVKGIRELGITVYPSSVNFLLLRYNWNSRDVKEELLKEGLLVRDCSNFHGLDTRFIRVSVKKRKDNQSLIDALKKQVEKGVKKGVECAYYPCHFEGQDCTYCFCPFYPCGDRVRGRFIIGRKGKKVWTCKDCSDVHRPAVVKRVKALLKGTKKELDFEKRLAIKKTVLWLL